MRLPRIVLAGVALSLLGGAASADTVKLTAQLAPVSTETKERQGHRVPGARHRDQDGELDDRLRRDQNTGNGRLYAGGPGPKP